ncbi:MAG: tRNA (cytidine(34)-2'-O)-methyltransferase [Bacteriovoracaceae bacterium]|nr:tRNA (cytidine(34)-2'-O)-methyltransferase [Bacteriovoracaceae bacterium]
MFNIVLHCPEIPGNTGSIGRTCVALGIPLILIRPYGFEITEKSVRRAGLDYWKHLKLIEYDSWNQFINLEKITNNSKLFFFENQANCTYFEAKFTNGAYLIFGGETKGIPDNLTTQYSEHIYKLPMNSPHIRSLNLSNVVTAAAYECLRQTSLLS